MHILHKKKAAACWGAYNCFLHYGTMQS